MLIWYVEQSQIDKNFTLKELKDFSEKKKAKVIVKGLCAFQNGVVTWLM